MIPDYLTDQNLDYITARGYTFKSFSADQIIDELRMRDIRLAMHGRNSDKGFSTIVDGTPLMGVASRWATLKNPFTSTIYRCVRLRKRIEHVKLRAKHRRSKKYISRKRWK